MSHPRDNAVPRTTPTTVDVTSPFDSTTEKGRPLIAPLESDPTADSPTALVRHEGFRELLPGSVVDEIYEIDARLGAGAMGEVYAARHLKLGKRVAIKVIGQRLSQDDEAIARFAMEARTLAQIQHPAIVAIDHVGELPDGRAYFSMEFLRGESLFDRLSRGRVPIAEALRVLDQMARGLEAAHAQGVTHRDLKPENVFLVHLPDEPPIVKLVDFGLAKLRVPDHRAELTQSGVAIGTPLYMSPEQMHGQGVDHRTDIYALGCVAYELLLGVPPFPDARTAPEIFASHLHAPPPLPRTIWPEIPPQLDLCLFAMLAKDPAHRPTLAQVRTVVAAVRADVPSRHATEIMGPRAAKIRPWTAAIVLLALIVGIAIGAILTASSSEGPRTTRPPTTAPVPTPTATTQPTVAAQVAPSATTEIPTPPRIRARGDRAAMAGSAAPRPQKSGSAAAAAPVSLPDTGSDATAVPETPQAAPPSKPKTTGIDRNQTINPFAKRKGTQ